MARSFADELSTEEVGRLDAFFKTPDGRYYVEEFQYVAAPVSIAMDAFVDTLVDEVMDAPDKPLDVIKSLDANEAVASRLVAKLMTQGDRDNFAASRDQFIVRIGKMTQPKATDKKAVALHKKKMTELGQAYLFAGADQLAHRARDQPEDGAGPCEAAAGGFRRCRCGGRDPAAGKRVPESQRHRHAADDGQPGVS